jgi:hypothetical protein
MNTVCVEVLHAGPTHNRHLKAVQDKETRHKRKNFLLPARTSLDK